MAPKCETIELKTNRIEALSDGIFAFAMTVLIFSFEILLEQPQYTDESALAAALYNMWPDLLFYVESFIILGVFWIEHHRQFHFIRCMNLRALFLNIVGLMFIALIPFSTVIVGDYGHMRIAAFLFEANLLIAGLLFYFNWSYAVRNSMLTDSGLTADIVGLYKRRNLIIPVVSLFAISVSYFKPLWGTILYFSCPLLF